MSAWILSIVGIILVTTLVSIVLPEGKLARYVKSILAFATILVVIAPLKEIGGKELDFSGIFTSSESGYQESFLYYINEKKAAALEQGCLANLEEAGMTGAKVTVLFVDDVTFSIEKVQVNVKNLVCQEDKPHNDRNVEIRRRLAEYLKIEVWQVELYE